MATITHTVLQKTDVYEIVEEVPVGYLVWNIGENAPEGYLPLCRPSHKHDRYSGLRDIDPDSLKAIKVEGAEIVLAAVSRGENTLPKMEQYVKRYRNSKTDWVQQRVALYRKAIPIMRGIKGIERLTSF